MREERLIVKPFEDFRLLEYHAFQEMNHHARAELTGSIPYVKKEEYIKAVRYKQEKNFALFLHVGAVPIRKSYRKILMVRR